MPTPEPGVSLRTLREELKLAVDRSSLRAVAKEVGLSPMGLDGFLKEDHTPHRATEQKLRAWYAEHCEDAADSARGRLDLYLDLVPAMYREEADAEQIEWLTDFHRRYRIPFPRWLRTLIDRNASGAPE